METKKTEGVIQSNNWVARALGTVSGSFLGGMAFSALDANNQGTAVSTLSLQRVWWSCANGDGGDAFARLDYEDSDGDIPIITLIDSGYWDFREFGGIPANTSSNSNQNDVNFVVAAAADSGNTFTCIAEFLKNY